MSQLVETARGENLESRVSLYTSNALDDFVISFFSSQAAVTHTDGICCDVFQVRAGNTEEASLSEVECCCQAVVAV